MITVTAGHSNTDPGAVSGSLREADLTVDLRNMIAYYLAKEGVAYRTDGTGKDNQPLTTAIKLESGSAESVELHFNSSSASSAKGIEVLSQDKDTGLAKKLAAAIHGVTGSPLRGDAGWKSEGSGQHSTLGFVRAGGLIVEVEFISNPEAMAVYQAKKWLVAKALAAVLIAQIKGS